MTPRVDRSVSDDRSSDVVNQRVSLPNAVDDGAPAGVELMVHGVSGTPPAELLRYPPQLVDLCFGDTRAGFYRRRAGLPSAEPEDDTEPSMPTKRPPGWVPEAFSWGMLTSGPATRALWLMFVPFVLVNLAHWMLPPTKIRPRDPDGKRTTDHCAAWSVRLLRVFGLTLSLTLLFALMVVIVDLVGWQCPGLPQCADRLGPLKLMAGWTPGARLAATSVPVLAVVALLLLMGRSNPRIGDPPPDADDRGTTPLSHPTFWNADRSVTRLRDCHLTVWFSGVAALVLAAALTIRDSAPHVPTEVLLSVHLLLIATGIAFTCSDRVTGRGGKGLRGDQTDRPPRWSRWMWTSALALSVAALVWVFASQWRAAPLLGEDKITVTGALPYLTAATSGLCIVQAVLLVAFGVATWLSKRSSEHLPAGYRPSLRGLAAPWVATLAWLASGEASVALGFWVARYLGHPVSSAAAADLVTRRTADAVQAATTSMTQLASPAAGSEVGSSSKVLRDFLAAANERAPVQLATNYFVASTINLVVIVVALLVAVATIVTTWRRGRGSVMASTWEDYSDPATKAAAPKATDGPAETADQKEQEQKEEKKRALMTKTRIKAISSARAWAALTNCAPVLLAALIGATVVACALIVLGRVVYSHLHPGEQPAWLGDGSANSDWTGVLLAGQAFTAFIAAAMIGLAYQAFRNADTRRRVAVLWDVATFWPHASHPLGPPCYGERAVPDLWLRATLLAQQSKLVITAHSQGTVIAAAALLINAIPSQGAAAQEQRSLMSRPVALLTFGSPLRRLYARNFPAYFGFDSLSKLKTAAQPGPSGSSRWVNLWALTDPIGEWIFQEDLNQPPLDTPTGPIVDRRLLDARSLTPVAGRYPPICGHSGFWTRHEYWQALDALAARIDSSTEAPPAPVPLDGERPGTRVPLSAAVALYRLPGSGE